MTMSTRRGSLFASTGLAARIERAESDLMARCVVPDTHERPSAQSFAIPIGGGFATYGGRGSPFSKVAGLGFGDVPTASELDDLEDRYAEHGAPVQFEVSTLGDPELGQCLTRRGYRLVSFENVLGSRIDTDAAFVAPSQIVVSRGEDRPDVWMDVVVAGSMSPDLDGVVQHETFDAHEIVRAESALVGAGSRRYLASVDGVAVGGAGLRIVERIAQLTGAATVPEHRRRGVQTELVRVRLRDARAEGCDLAVVTCQPGSVSHANMQKMGFQLLYTRAILVGPNASP